MGTVPENPAASSRSARSAPRSRGIFARRSSGTEEPDGPTVAVSVRDLTVTYGTVDAVRDASIDMLPGTIVAIIGPNGSGKSTLLSTISGLVAPSRGRVLVHGQPPKQGRRRVAHVLQTTIANQSLPLTVRETVRMGCYADSGMLRRLTPGARRAVDEAIERMRIGNLLHRQLHELSGGQRQRTYVAQGLAQRADVLLLDEPITGLDLTTQETISQLVAEERAKGRTVVLTTHDVGTARLADQVVLLATEVVASGPPAEVLTAGNLASAYGGHLHVLDDGSTVLDDPHQHRPD